MTFTVTFCLLTKNFTHTGRHAFNDRSCIKTPSISCLASSSSSPMIHPLFHTIRKKQPEPRIKRRRRRNPKLTMRNPSSSASTAGAGKTTSTPTPCCSKVGLKRGPWTPEEDELLSSYINREGEGRWRTLPKRAGLLRCGKSCRLRWMNYLRPSVKRGQIAADEEDLILRLHRLLGNRWSLIAGRIPGRTDNEIKNYWNTHLSKKLISQGIDPRTHKPFNSSAPSSCPPAPLPAPQRANLSPNSAVADITRASAATGRAPPAEGTFQGADMDQGLGSVGNGTWHNSDGLMMMGLSSGHGKRHREDEMEFCTDDIFSSFLNSLITEDTLMQQQQNCTLVTPSDSMIHDQATNYGYGRRWDGTVPSSAAANEDGHD